MIGMVRWMAWHLHRRALIGFGGGGFLISFLYGAAFNSAAGTTPQSQAEFGRATTLVAKQFAFLIPVPVHPETLGGYEQYKWLAGAIVMMMIWAGLVGVGVGRGDEDRGLTPEWLVSGVSRTRLLLARSAAFGLVVLVACFASVIGISAIAPFVQQDANVGGELLKGISMAVGLFSGYALALLISQLPPERQTATALGVGALVLLLVVNGIADTIDSLSWIGVISPFHWMEQTSTAAPGGTFDVPATLGLAVVAAALLVIAFPAFNRRDIGSGLVGWRLRTHHVARTASRNPLLRWPFTEGLWEQRVGLLIWAASTFFLAAVMVSVTKSVTEALLAAPSIAALFQRIMPGSLYTSMLGLIYFSFALLVLAGYAVVQVSRWSAQDQDGRVELLLSSPVSRSAVIVNRALEFALASLLIVLGGYLGVLTKLPTAGFSVDTGHLLIASALMWPFTLAFGGLGIAVASRWPRIAVAFLAAFAVVQYFLGDLAPLFKLPGWVANLSFFHLYGNPLADGGSWTPVFWMMLVFLAGFGAALVLMQRRDVAGA